MHLPLSIIICVISFTFFNILLLDTLGRVICTGSDDATLRIWNPKSGENIHIVQGMLISLYSVFPIYKSQASIIFNTKTAVFSIMIQI